jgi:hypothetical protein
VPTQPLFWKLCFHYSTGNAPLSRSSIIYPNIHAIAFFSFSVLCGHAVSSSMPKFRTHRRTAPQKFFRAWRIDPAVAADRLQNARLLFFGLEPWGISACASLAQAGIGTIHILDDEVLTAREELRAQVENHANCKIGFSPIHLNPDDSLEVPAGNIDLVVACLRNDELRVLTAIAHFAHKYGLPTRLSLCSKPGISGKTCILPRRLAI